MNTMFPIMNRLQCTRFSRFINSTLFHMKTCMLSTGEKENDEVIVDKLGEVMTIGINRPHKRNSINKKTALRLCEVLNQFESDETAVIGVLHGTGGNFCAGYDLEEFTKHHKLLQTIIPLKSHLSKPLVAAVSGYALGAGFELALMCDLRVVEETAVFGFFNRRFGVPCVNGGTVRLQAMVGLSRALDVILTGRAVKSEEAMACGLANRVVACGTALGQAINLANSIKKFSQACLLSDRSSTYYTAFTATNIQDAVKFEQDSAQRIIQEESFNGAEKFISGIGRHGEFKNISNGTSSAVTPHNKSK